MEQLIRLHKILFVIAGLSVARALPDLGGFAFFRPYIEIADKKFPAMIVNGLVVATTMEAGDSDDSFLCVTHPKEKAICIEVLEKVHTFEEEKISLLSVPLEPGLSFFFSLFNLSYNQQCQAVSINHEPIAMSLKEDGTVVCDTCQHMDIIICMYECIGALAYDKSLLPYWKLLTIAESIVGSDMDPQLFGQESAKLFERSIANINSTATDISPFRKDAVLLRLSSVIFISFSIIVFFNLICR